MKQLLAMERRLQDLERRLENKQRNGKVSEVKFDKDKKRWFVKMEDGEGDETFRSDWLPWKSFSHGAISMSIPPKKGMRITVHSPNGEPEMGVAEPYHYNPDDPAPHDKEDEVVFEVRDPQNKNNPQTTLRLHFSKGKAKITLGDSTFDLTKDQVDASVDKQKMTVTKTKTSISNDKGKVELMQDGKIESRNNSGAKVILTKMGMLLLNS